MNGSAWTMTKIPLGNFKLHPSNKIFKDISSVFHLSIKRKFTQGIESLLDTPDSHQKDYISKSRYLWQAFYFTTRKLLTCRFDEHLPYNAIKPYKLRIFLVRHGESYGNKDKVFFSQSYQHAEFDCKKRRPQHIT